MTEGKSHFFSDQDRALIRILQQDLPLCERPYAEVAAGLGLTEQEVLGRVKDWIRNGVIRRLGATVSHRQVGYRAGCMVVWRVEHEAEQARVGGMFASLEQVTHCYLRPALEGWPYNLYTMVHGADTAEIEALVEQMSADSG
ncbi:MAG: AsnC family transcriptional regulator, partial [Gemmatimonadota bacterium]|nr:AsnC family transcriptional regulator [Gemmatimonadota bacterium]